MAKAHPVICIVGPTASGKTDAAQLVARALDGEVVSADSMQIYRGMDIGTGKLPAAERIVAHHGFDLVSPGEPYSAALFQAYARAVFDDIAARGKRAVLCGGTGLYVRAAIDDYEFPAGEQVENPVRVQWTAFAEREGAQALWDELNRRDPESARELHPNNVRRVVRAFELLAEGRSYAEQKRNLALIGEAVPALQFGLAVTPEVLNARIDARVDAMVEAGLVEEVRGLLAAGFREGVTAPQAIGYKEVVEALEGRCTLDEAVAAIKQATRRYGKRQRTWFRRDGRIRWIDADAGDARAVADEIIAQLETLA
ncbi:tRNA (adenosine(37)-N6)-dimethylallyltransferase MiaA [Enterorhabdus mucosicola]|uniref:tRNA dimethylallyltransferase n=1 Tax=Adlercreutzia mucosicola TaxID=580026 RepID=A0A6N8JJ89_9ACTN|nr:tRNA (adenosine(37)-N6)-dimethylallyltransferase MiaA [Adlercreutzia mucosicola]MVX59928.1 tRNA (adenosine(37)-N6)-dimethylallyltransferase MiaA [Adlercreutzia mucosicola]